MVILVARKEFLDLGKLSIYTKPYKFKLLAYIRKKKLEKEGYEVGVLDK